MRTIFFTISISVLEKNGLLNKNNWEDLDVIDQGHIRCNVSQFCLYLGYPWSNFNKIRTTMIAMAGDTKISHQLTLKMYVKVTIYKNRFISTITLPIFTNIS